MRKMLRWSALLVVSMVGMIWCQTAAAQNINRNDRLLLYYSYYVGQQNTRQILQEQRQLDRQYNQFQSRQNLRGRQVDPIENYIREGRERDPQGQQLPPIYSGQGGQHQYFQNIRYFNPPRRY